jgi:hypothetical protein
MARAVFFQPTPSRRPTPPDHKDRGKRKVAKTSGQPFRRLADVFEKQPDVLDTDVFGADVFT